VGAAGIGNFTGTAVGTKLRLDKPELVIVTCLSVAGGAVLLCGVLFSITFAVVGMFVTAVSNALSKIALDALIQRDVVETQRSSAFARSETFLQLAWVLGAAFGVLLPVSHGGGVGFMVGGAVVSTVAVVVVLRYRVLTGRAAAAAHPAGSVSDREQRRF
jgi:predicted MFS family arabinose efflux permease